MRNFYIRSGKFIGTHLIFDSIEEFQASMPGVEYKSWNSLDPREIKNMDWIEADDGYIIQCLRINVMKMKKAFPYPTWTFRFPIGMFSMRQNKSGEFKRMNFYAQFAKADKGSLSAVPRSLRSIPDLQKVKYATLITAGVPVHRAYLMAFWDRNMRPQSSQVLLRKAAMALNDDVVRTELKSQLDMFRKKLDDRFDLDRLIDEVDDLIRHSKKGSDAHRENLKFLMVLKGMVQEKGKASSRAVAEIEEAQVIAESNPPALGS